MVPGLLLLAGIVDQLTFPFDPSGIQHERSISSLNHIAGSIKGGFLFYGYKHRPAN